MLKCAKCAGDCCVVNSLTISLQASGMASSRRPPTPTYSQTERKERKERKASHGRERPHPIERHIYTGYVMPFYEKERGHGGAMVSHETPSRLNDGIYDPSIRSRRGPEERVGGGGGGGGEERRGEERAQAGHRQPSPSLAVCFVPGAPVPCPTSQARRRPDWPYHLTSRLGE